MKRMRLVRRTVLLAVLALAAVAAPARAQGPAPRALDRTVVLADGRSLGLGDTLAPALRRQLVPRPDGKLAWIGPRLTRPAGAQLVVRLDDARRIDAIEVVHPAKTTLASVLARYREAYGPPGLEIPGPGGQPRGASWQDGEVGLTVQAFARSNGTFVVTRVCSAEGCAR